MESSRLLTGVPAFSVIVPVYNHERYISAALDSLLAQTDPDWEALIVDDGSTDGTPAIVDEYARRDGRFRVSHKPNGGTASALNAGIRAAVGEWICWLSSDDLFTPDKLAVHRRWIAEQPNGKVFFTGFRRLDEETGLIGDGDQGPVPRRPWQLLGLLDYNFINGITLCVHRSAFDRAGLFDEANPFGQDYGMNLRLLSVHEAFALPDRCAITRVHPGQGGRMENRLMFQDCSTAAIRFLAETDFVGLFPLADLEDARIAAEAVERTLDIAMSPHAYVNQLGAHPALALCAMAWLWSVSMPWGDGLRRDFLWRARAAARQMGGTEAGAMWRALFVLGASANAGGVRCSVVDPVVVAERACADRSRDPANMTHLARYFEKRLRRPPPDRYGWETRGELLAAGIGEEEAAAYSNGGWRVTLLNPGSDTLRLEPWGWVVGTGVKSRGQLSRILCRVDAWDAAVATDDYAATVAPACRTVPVCPGDSLNSGISRAWPSVRARRTLCRMANRVNGLAWRAAGLGGWLTGDGRGGPRPSIS